MCPFVALVLQIPRKWHFISESHAHKSYSKFKKELCQIKETNCFSTIKITSCSDAKIHLTRYQYWLTLEQPWGPFIHSNAFPKCTSAIGKSMNIQCQGRHYPQEENSLYTGVLQSSGQSNRKRKLTSSGQPRGLFSAYFLMAKMHDLQLSFSKTPFCKM